MNKMCLPFYTVTLCGRGSSFSYYQCEHHVKIPICMLQIVCVNWLKEEKNIFDVP